MQSSVELDQNLYLIINTTEPVRLLDWALFDHIIAATWISEYGQPYFTETFWVPGKEKLIVHTEDFLRIKSPGRLMYYLYKHRVMGSPEKSQMLVSLVMSVMDYIYE